MLRVRFGKEFLIDENGEKINLEEEILIAICLENADVSIRVIEIIRYSLETLGYELCSNNYKYRNSDLFNSIEPIIVKAEKYQNNKNKLYERQERKSECFLSNVTSYTKKRAERELLIHRQRRPQSFSMSSK